MGIQRLLRGIVSWLSPAVVERTAEAQRQVDEESGQLVFYYFKSCPYCYKVNRTIARLNLKVEYRNIHASKEHSLELFQGGGKQQVPCLRIPALDGKVVWLYESNDIVRYLKQRFPTIT